MAVRGFFYNATDLNDKERRYNGQDMNEDKAPFYKEGVVYGHLQVTAGDGMEVRVDGGSRRGYAYINLHTIHNTAVLPLTVSQASGTLPRIDRVIVRNDETERRPSIFIREGAFSSKPQPPGLINNDVIQEKSLARVYVRAGAVAITQADITDERADDSVCGFVASQFKELDFSQFLSQFNAWFAEVKKAMEKDHAAFVKEYTELIRDFMDGREADLEQFNAWLAKEKKAMEKDRLSFMRNGKSGSRESRMNLPGTWPGNCSCRLTALERKSITWRSSYGLPTVWKASREPLPSRLPTPQRGGCRRRRFQKAALASISRKPGTISWKRIWKP